MRGPPHKLDIMSHPVWGGGNEKNQILINAFEKGMNQSYSLTVSKIVGQTNFLAFVSQLV